MAGKLQFSLEEFQHAAIKYRKELLMLPIIGISDTLKWMSGRPGIRHKESVGYMKGSAQFAPYKPSRSTNINLDIDFRTLETFFGSVVGKFEPNTAIKTLLGTGATKGDGQMTTPTAKHVLALMAQSLSLHLNNAIWSGVRNENGDTTADLFDGFDTITRKEIQAGTIAASEKNYIKLDEKITKANAVDLSKEILWQLDPLLRDQELLMFCSQDFADKYNEAYLLTHAGIPYNGRYDQTCVEGSNGRLKLVPLYNKHDSNFIHICPKSNMLVGYDQMSDTEEILIKEFEPFILSYIATMFFGVQFESIDRRRFMCVELANDSSNGGSGSASNNPNTGAGTPPDAGTDDNPDYV